MDILEKAIKHYGTENQLGVLCEESAELIQAISKYKRYKDDIETKQHIAEEIADVLIMIDQAKIILDIKDYEIDYPVAFWMENISNDKARIEELGKNDKTLVARAFLNTVKDAGYIPMVYGTKEWLIKEVDLSKLSEYDIWLSQSGDIPDYPYRFSMWQYSNTGDLSGIPGYADLNISFIDYSAR